MADYYGNYNHGSQQSGGSSGFYGGGGGFNQDQGGGFGGYGAQQWQQPQSDPMQSYGGGQQQQQQSQPNYFTPLAAVAGSISNDQMMQIGKGFLQSGTARMVPGLESAMLMLRSYFAVDNNYVKIKIQKVLFPFRSKHWKRTVRAVGVCEAWT
jgi:YIF1